MAHLFRWRNIIQAINENTELDISEKRKEQIGKLVKRGEEMLPALKAMGETKGIIGILAKALAYNLEDYIKILKGTRFVKL